MCMMEDKNFLLEFIEVYRSLPALWKIKSKEYSNRYLKNEQYEMLLLKYKEKYPDATKKDVTQKINVLRTNYRRELKRILALEKSGAGRSEDNDPTLFYFEAMDFMRDNKKSCASRSSLSGQNETEEVETPRKRKNPDSSDELIALATKRLAQPRDEFRSMADTWALKLKKLDETERIFAKKFINEILFEGQMGTLHRNAMHLNVKSGPSTSYQASYSRSAPGSSSLLDMPISPNIQSSASEISYADENLGSVSPQNIIEVWESESELAEEAVEFSSQNTEVSRYFSSFK